MIFEDGEANYWCYNWSSQGDGDWSKIYVCDTQTFTDDISFTAVGDVQIGEKNAEIDTEKLGKYT